MSVRIIGVLSVAFCWIGVGFAQSSPADQNGAMSSIQLAEDQAPPTTLPDDARLVLTPPVPGNEEQQFEQGVKDIHFDFDRAELRPEDRQVLQQDAEWLKAHPDVIVTIEGDADERGDIVYNVVLSGARAEVTSNALLEMGVRPQQIAFATGWGKLYPVCTQSEESCWSQNRRTHFATWPPAEENTQVAISLVP